MEDEDSEQSVIVYFNYGSVNFEPVNELAKQLDKILESSGVGEYDGKGLSTDGSGGTLYMYGKDAHQVFAAVRETLEATPLMQNAVAVLRFGTEDEDAREEEILIGKPNP